MWCIYQIPGIEQWVSDDIHFTIAVNYSNTWYMLVWIVPGVNYWFNYI